MSVLPLQTARVSNLLRTSVAQQAIAQTQSQLLEVQNQLSTGKRVNAPGDDPTDAAVILQIQKTLEQRKAFATNVDQAKSQLGEVDATLQDLNELLQQAQTIASANVGSDVTADQRASAATIIQNLYTQAITLGNKQLNGTYIFAGDLATDPPFVTSDGGVKFVGSSTVLSNQVDESTSVPFMVDGSAVFGATSTRVQGSADLTPSLSMQTRLSDVHGAANSGVKLGPITLGNGTTSKVVDLTNADTIGDVADAINAAAVGNITATVGGGGLVLSTTGTDNITVTDIGGGTAAKDLGILRSVGTGAGTALNGGTVSPKVTPLTLLSDLKGGAGIDTAGGLTITSGTKSATVVFTSPPLKSPATVEDLTNAINNSGTDVSARINADGTGIDVVNPSQGVQMSIGENGGTTAADLGVRSMTGASTLAELNNGTGVRTGAGADLQINRTDGSSFSVDLDGAATIQDVINRINAADTVNGTIAATVVASLKPTGNGLLLTDSAGGPGTLTISSPNVSEAATDLGLASGTAAGNTLTGTDVNPIAAQGVFANLAKLRDALTNSDQVAITSAAGGLQKDQQRVTLIRGETGARVQDLESRGSRLEDENLASQSLLSNLQDTDYTAAISRFQMLQTALQASFETASRSLNLSLMDFLQ